MPNSLTDRDISLFSRDAVEYQSDVCGARSQGDDVRAARYLRAHRLAACAYYTQAQDDVRGSGYRVTQRVKDLLWAALSEIEAEELGKPLVTVVSAALAAAGHVA